MNKSLEIQICLTKKTLPLFHSEVRIGLPEEVQIQEIEELHLHLYFSKQDQEDESLLQLGLKMHLLILFNLHKG
jgi:hypothetical protein